VGFRPYLQDQLVSFSALTLFGLFGHMTCKNCPRYISIDMCLVGRQTLLNLAQSSSSERSITQICVRVLKPHTWQRWTIEVVVGR